jgi:glycosyltransferase involved in cell wall biosynthesis
MGGTRVSIVVTCFNLGEFLAEALESVDRQTFQDHELIIVDDGSDDAATLATLESCKAQGLQVLRTANRGLSAARNAGIAATSAEFVCCLDADDRLLPTMLERSVSVLDGSPDLAFASHWLRAFGHESWDWRPELCDFPDLLDVNTVNGAALVRRTAIEAVGGYDETWRDGCEDWDLWISMVERGYRGTIIPEFLFEYRRRLNSMSRVMQRRIGHPELYRRLMAKHSGTFRAHLSPLLLRRERDLATLRRHVQAMELEGEYRLNPELAGLRDDVTMLERRLELLIARRAEADQVSRLSAELESRNTELERMGHSVRQLDMALRQAERDVHALRTSASWRVTGPLRAVYRMLTRRGSS